MIAHSNETYNVHSKSDGTGYFVVNKETGVTEFEDSQIANVITYAEHGQGFLKHKLWRSVAIQAEATADFLNKKDAEVVFEADPDLSDELA